MKNQQAMAAGLMLYDEGISLSLHSEKPVPPPFLTKTYHLVDDANTDHIVSWGDRDDSTFVVWRPPEFARDLLPNYFKHSNFSSFVRQLNTYGFRKMVPDRWEFANEFFKKGEKHLLCEIQRRKTSSSHHLSGQTYFPYYPTRLSDVSPPESDSWREDDSPPALSLSSLVALSEDNERLRRSNGVLAAELAHMRKLYSDIIYFVQNHVKPVSPSSSLFLSQVNVIDHDAAGAGGCRSTTKLFGVPLPLHSSNETNKAPLVPEKNHDLGFNLML